MKAMILAAGLGTRLRPLTDSAPKCLMQAGGKTLLEHTVERLKRAGVTAVVINLHHLAEAIKEFVRRQGNFGIEVAFSEERELLDTGGGLKKAAAFFSGESEFILHNADVYTEVELSRVVQFHASKKALATLVVMERPSSRRLLFASNGDLIGHENSSSGKRVLVRDESSLRSFAFSGIHILSTDLFRFMQGQGDKFSIIDTFLDAAKQGARIQGWSLGKEFWIDIGSEEKLKALRKRLGEDV